MKNMTCRQMMNLCLGILILLSGCVSGQLQRPVTKDITVVVQKHEPYCGGAHPSKSQEAGYTTALRDISFFVKTGDTNHDTIPVLRSVTTDTLGRFSVQLDTGTYALIFRNKHQTFEAFYKEVSRETKQLRAGKVDCFQTWWQKPQAVFHISDTTSLVRCTIASSCNTGFNPCMYYVGPKRP